MISYHLVIELDQNQWNWRNMKLKSEISFWNVLCFQEAWVLHRTINYHAVKVCRVIFFTPRLLLVPCHVPVLFVANAAHDNEVMLLHFYADYSIPVKSSEWPNSIDIRSPQQSISFSFLLHVLSMYLTLQFHVIFSWTYPSVKCKCPMTGTKQHVFKILY